MIKLYADENIRKLIVSILRHKGFDIISTEESENKGKSDIEQLKFAISEERSILTNDSDFLLVKNLVKHYGIFFITKKKPDKDIANKVASLLEMLSKEDIRNAVIYI